MVNIWVYKRCAIAGYKYENLHMPAAPQLGTFKQTLVKDYNNTLV